MAAYLTFILPPRHAYELRSTMTLVWHVRRE